MKNIIYSAAFAITFVALVSCSNDEQPIPVAFTEENPLPGLLQQTNLGQRTLSYIDDNNYYDMGIAFVPMVKGKINSFIVKLPESHRQVRITVWNRTTRAILMTTYIDVLSANTNTLLEITPLALEKDKEYVVAISSDDYYMLFQENGSSVTYPVTVGNIKINGGTDQMGNGQEMPEFYTANAISGLVTFNFQQTE